MASKLGICNLALSQLGIGKDINNFDTEKSEEAAACRTFYDLSLEETLREFEWSFTTRDVALALVEEDPTSEWDFAYRYPAYCLHFRRIFSGVRNDNRQTSIPYRITSDSTGKLIYTDLEDAECEFTYNVTDPQLYPIDFVGALSLKLAYYIAPRVTKGDPFKIRENVLGLYALALSKAQANSVNEEQREESPEAEFIRGRD